VNRSSIPFITGLLLIVTGSAFLAENLASISIWRRSLPYWPVVLLIMGAWALIRAAYQVKAGLPTNPWIWAAETAFAGFIILLGFGLTQLAEYGPLARLVEPELVTEERRIVRRIDFNEKVLQMERAEGDIQVIGWDKPDIELVATWRASGVTSLSAKKKLAKFAKFRMSRQNQALFINFPHPESQEGISALLVSLVVKAPKSALLDLGVSGKMSVSDFQGDAKVRNDNGTTNIENIGGNVDLWGAVGQIQARFISGDVTAGVNNGSISISDTSGAINAFSEGGLIKISQPAGAVKARTDYGAIEVRSDTSPASAWDLASKLGSIEMELPKGAHFDIDAATDAGRISGAFYPASTTPFGQKHRRWRGPRNGGGPPVKLRSQQGEIRMLASP